MGIHTPKRQNMKLLITLAVSALAQTYAPPTTEETTTIVPNTGLSCFHCDAANMTECQEIGEQKACADNAQVCMIEVRKRNGVLESVCMGLVQKRSIRLPTVLQRRRQLRS